MTCIVGLVENGVVFIGGDSAGVAGLDVDLRKDVKVFKAGKFLIGYTSSFRMGQLLRFKLKVKNQTKSQSDYEFMCTTFIDSVRDCLTKGGYAELNSNSVSIGTFLVGYKNRLYTICNDLQVGESWDNYSAVGCGKKYALGALSQINFKRVNPRDAIERALTSAVKFSGGVRPPFIIEELS